MSGTTRTAPVVRAAALRRMSAGRAWMTAGWAGRADVILVVTVWAGVLVPQLVESLTVAKGFAPITASASAPPALVAAVTTAANGLMVLACAAVVLLRLRTIELRRLPLLAALLAPWCIAAGQLAVLGRPPVAPALVYPAVAVAFWTLRPGRDAVQAVGYLTGLTAAISLTLGALAPAAGLYPLDTAGLEKAVGSAGVLSGVMPTGNNLGLLLVVGLPTVLTIRRASLRWAALGAVLLALAWTSSRTSWVAAVVVLLFLAALALLRRRAAIAAAGLGLLALVGVVLPFVTTEPTAFTNRAGYWIPLLASWRDQALTGFGTDYFPRLAQTPQNLGGHAYHAHNEWVQLLVTGGLLLATAAVVPMVIAAVRAVRLSAAGVTWGAGWLAALLTVSVLEVPLGFVDRMMFLPVTLVPLCLLICADRFSGQPDPGVRVEASTGDPHG